MADEQIVTHKSERPDSIEYGTPKVGVLKVYVNVANFDEAKTLIDNGKKLLEFARGVQNDNAGTDV
jgi:hypothetical protein